MPNSFAYLALLCWPIVSLLLFKKYSALHATFWTIVGGALLLPVNVSFDMQGLPSIGKMSVCTVSALLLCKYKSSAKINWIPKRGAERYFIFLLLLTPLITALTNGEPIYRGESFLPPLSLYHGFSDTLDMYIFIIPFLLGVQLVKTYEDQITLFRLIVIAGLWYSIPILLEIRLSPQLHTWIYGFFPHSFLQQRRFGGFRAVVFLGHGLVVAMFVVVVLASSVLLWKEKIRATKYSPAVVVMYLIVVLVLCKSVGPGFLGFVFVTAMAWASVRLVKGLTVFTTVVVVGYPLLCLYGLFPHNLLVSMVEPFDVSKSGSLAFRFFHESQLLDLALEKPLFGWGGWGRHRLEDSVTDGYWVVIFGKYGLAGFIGIFGLISFAVLRGLRSSALVFHKSEKRMLVGHALLVAIIMVDQIPNSSLSRGWMLLLVGALLARANNIIRNRISKSDAN